MYCYDPQTESWADKPEPEKRTFPHYPGPLERLRLPTMHFSIYDNWEGSEVECPNCGWQGTLKDNGPYLGTGFQVVCGDCFHVLAEVLFATHEEAIAAGDTSTVMMFEIMESRMKRFQHTCLKTVDQLPEIDEQDFVLTWDTIERSENDSESYTLIRHNDQFIFKELAFFEGGFRYEQVAKILKQKYGDRLKDLEPTYMGWMYLGGDSFRSLQDAEDARKALFDKPDE